MRRYPAFKPNMLNTRPLAGFYFISPEVAGELLSLRNVSNRSIKPIKLDQLIHDIREGQFFLNGESIVFANTGELIDGQHRLEACRQSGIGINALVVEGIDPSAKATVDQGSARTTGDILQMTGTEYGNITASIAKLAFSWVRGEGQFGSLARISRADTLGMIDGDPTLVDAAKYGANNSITGLASASVIGFCYWLIGRQYGVDEAEAYLNKVVVGEGLLLGDGALAARNRLIGLGKVATPVKIEIILRGFVAHFQGAKVSKLLVMKSLPALPSTRRPAPRVMAEMTAEMAA